MKLTCHRHIALVDAPVVAALVLLLGTLEINYSVAQTTTSNLPVTAYAQQSDGTTESNPGVYTIFMSKK